MSKQAAGIFDGFDHTECVFTHLLFWTHRGGVPILCFCLMLAGLSQTRWHDKGSPQCQAWHVKRPSALVCSAIVCLCSVLQNFVAGFRKHSRWPLSRIHRLMLLVVHLRCWFMVASGWCNGTVAGSFHISASHHSRHFKCCLDPLLMPAVWGAGLCSMQHSGVLYSDQMLSDWSEIWTEMACMLTLFRLIAACCRYRAGVDPGNYNREGTSCFAGLEC